MAAEANGPAPTFTSKGDGAYAALRERILFGELPAGSRLAQYELAQAFGVSITPVREAVRRLAGEGLIVLDTHRDARVAEMTDVEARELFEARRALEPAALALAARNRTEADLAGAREALDALLPVTRDAGPEALRAHRRLHRALYAASHSSVIVRLLDDIWDKSDRYRRAGLDLPSAAGPRRRDFDEHGDLVRLVAEGDADGAAALALAHIDRSLAAEALSGEALGAEALGGEALGGEALDREPGDASGS